MQPSPGAFDAMFTIVPVIIVLGFVAVIGTMIYRFFAARREGFDPLAADIQLAAKARDSQLLAPGTEDRTVEERLAEADALLASGRITAAEHQAARLSILGDI
jgi:hypothetical protein